MEKAIAMMEEKKMVVEEKKERPKRIMEEKQ
jgi:hypothetical protein